MQTEIVGDALEVEFRTALVKVVICGRTMDAFNWDAPKPEIPVWFRHEASNAGSVIRLDAMDEFQMKLLKKLPPKSRQGIIELHGFELERIFREEITDSILSLEPVPPDPIAVGWRTLPANTGIAQVIEISRRPHARTFKD